MAFRDLVPWGWGRHGIPVHRGRSFGSTGFDDLFEQLLEDFWVPSGPEFAAVAPRVDVAETDSHYQVTAELPGVDEKDVKVSLAEGVLTLEGERKAEQTDDRRGYHRRERTHGSFQRVIRLPGEVDADGVSASFKQGVLTVTLPKAAVARARRVEVTTG